MFQRIKEIGITVSSIMGVHYFDKLRFAVQPYPELYPGILPTNTWNLLPGNPKVGLELERFLMYNEQELPESERTSLTDIFPALIRKDDLSSEVKIDKLRMMAHVGIDMGQFDAWSTKYYPKLFMTCCSLGANLELGAMPPEVALDLLLDRYKDSIYTGPEMIATALRIISAIENSRMKIDHSVNEAQQIELQHINLRDKWAQLLEQKLEQYDLNAEETIMFNFKDKTIGTLDDYLHQLGTITKLIDQHKESINFYPEIHEAITRFNSPNESEDLSLKNFITKMQKFRRDTIKDHILYDTSPENRSILQKRLGRKSSQNPESQGDKPINTTLFKEGILDHFIDTLNPFEYCASHLKIRDIDQGAKCEKDKAESKEREVKGQYADKERARKEAAAKNRER